MRRSADTNVLIRLLIKDDERQPARALTLVHDGTLVIQPTVLLETEWVLRGLLGYRKSDVEKALDDLLALPNIELVEEDQILRAIELHRGGMDFADALHLALAAEADEFVSFDRAFARRAARIERNPPVRLL